MSEPITNQNQIDTDNHAELQTEDRRNLNMNPPQLAIPSLAASPQSPESCSNNNENEKISWRQALLKNIFQDQLSFRRTHFAFNDLHPSPSPLSSTAMDAESRCSLPNSSSFLLNLSPFEPITPRDYFCLSEGIQREDVSDQNADDSSEVEMQQRMDYIAAHIGRIVTHLAQKQTFLRQATTRPGIPGNQSDLKNSLPPEFVRLVKTLYTPNLNTLNGQLALRFKDRIRTPPPASNHVDVYSILTSPYPIGMDLAFRCIINVGMWSDVGIRKNVNEDESGMLDLREGISEMLASCEPLEVLKLHLPDGVLDYVIHEAVEGWLPMDHECPPPDTTLMQAFSDIGPLPFIYAAVYDGHNGQEASQFMNLNFVPVMLRCRHFWAMEFTECMLKTFAMLEELQKPRMGLVDEDDFDAEAGGRLTPGTTGVVMLIVGPKVVVAHVGDSKALLCRAGVALELTADHQPSVPVEKWRFEAEGEGAGDTGGGYLNGFLAVSGAMGGYHRLSRKKLRGLRSRPDVLEFNLQPEDEFLMLACDGIFDVYKPSGAIDVVRKHLRSKPPTSLTDYEGAAQILIENVKNRGGPDNLTVLVIGLKYV